MWCFFGVCGVFMVYDVGLVDGVACVDVNVEGGDYLLNASFTDEDGSVNKIINIDVEAINTGDGGSESSSGITVLSNGISPSHCLIMKGNTYSFTTTITDSNEYLLDTLNLLVLFKDKDNYLFVCDENNFEKFCVDGTELPEAVNTFFLVSNEDFLYDVFISINGSELVQGTVESTHQSSKLDYNKQIHGCTFSFENLGVLDIPVPIQSDHNPLPINMDVTFVNKDNSDENFEVHFSPAIDYGFPGPNAPKGVINFKGESML